MRAIFYTDAEIDATYRTWAPKLHAYARDCRAQHPLPDPAMLTTSERKQFRLLTVILTEFRDTAVRYREPLVEVIHGSPITLLAARDAFANYTPEVVFLLSEERHAWYETTLNKPDGWYVSSWATIHDPMPDQLAAEVSGICSTPAGGVLWLVTKARYGKASHEVWTWDGRHATPTKRGWEQLTEDGTIDSLDELLWTPPEKDPFGANHADP